MDNITDARIQFSRIGELIASAVTLVKSEGNNDVDNEVIVLNTVNGDSNIQLFASLNATGYNVPTMSMSIGEPEVASIGASVLAGMKRFQSFLHITMIRYDHMLVMVLMCYRWICELELSAINSKRC
jgi:hypothetical protein